MILGFNCSFCLIALIGIYIFNLWWILKCLS